MQIQLEAGMNHAVSSGQVAGPWLPLELLVKYTPGGVRTPSTPGGSGTVVAVAAAGGAPEAIVEEIAWGDDSRSAGGGKGR
jgi:hypothetical protein